MTEDQPKNQNTTKEPTKEDKKKEEEDELSEEDQELKSQLELLVERLSDSTATNLYPQALESLRTLIRTATSSMTSVPKPLKFLGPHYKSLCEVYVKWAESNEKKLFADILAVLSMTYAEDDAALKYKLAGSAEPIGSWGHEFVRNLSSHLINAPTPHLELANEIIPFFLSHNAEADACDLAIELEMLSELVKFVDKDTYKRVCLYILSCVNYVAPPDDVEILRCAHDIYSKVGEAADAMRVAIRLGDIERIKTDFEACSDLLTKKQLAYMLARQRIWFDTDDEDFNAILSNADLSEKFYSLARDLDILEPKTPEDIYKSHLENVRVGTVDSAKQNLAATFVNAFVNAGFRGDKLMLTDDESSWVYKNKDHGMLSAVASVGMIELWDLSKMNELDKYMYPTNDYIKAGALLGLCLLTSGVRDEAEAVFGYVREDEWINNKSEVIRASAIAGLGIANAGSAHEDVLELLLPFVSDTGLSMELSSLAALSLGQVFVGTSHGDIASTILQTMMERDDVQLKDPYAKFMGLGLALLFLGKQEDAEASLETLKAIEHPLAKLVGVLVEICAYAGTGNVLKVQQMLQYCTDHLDPEKEDDKFQAIAVLGIAVISMGEDIGSEMALRSFNHLMHYGEPIIRKTVPLAIALLCASNPAVNVLDILGKYSHDNDTAVALNAIFAMGVVGAGTNNARLAQMLRQLAAYYYKEPDCLFMVRIAQGLVHMGKGTMTINPYHSDRTLMSTVGVSGLLTVLLAFTDVKTIILGKSHWMLYYLVLSMYPRFLITLDENLKSLPVTVRVGQAVDVVGQAGRPKTITGFQTHSTPVLLGFTERAELATEEWLPVTGVLEGFVILKKNPEYMEDDTDKAGK